MLYVLVKIVYCLIFLPTKTYKSLSIERFGWLQLISICRFRCTFNYEKKNIDVVNVQDSICNEINLIICEALKASFLAIE